jgi:excisionase family DNA binding protein
VNARPSAVATMSIPELGERLRISRMSAYRLVQQRRIATVPVGSGSRPRMRVTEDAFADFLARNTEPAKA